MLKLQTYEIHYIDRQGRVQVYRNSFCLCIDGAEEAFKLDVKGNCKQILDVRKVA